ncbi:MAG: polyprenyl synthetase family protein [Pyrinomonadaceae bacterium]|nr:polyprenyl synthetase family protein [Pyrinomonadaceae bacterium]
MRASSEAVKNTESAQGFFAEARALIDARLDALLPKDATEPQSLHAAIRWSVFAGGKRFRPSLMLAAGRAFGAGDDALLNTACALEMIHTYSLIHDDLPAMDDDDLRRGRPTCHVRFGEAVAILAGDVLQTLAFQVISEDEKLAPDVRVRLIAELARAAGTPYGMVAGQAYDLIAASHESSPEELERIHLHKTGALIQAAARSGAIIAGAKADDTELQALTRYAAQLGLLFQITDDLLDVTATAEDLGKTPGKDERASKATYPALYGLEEARGLAQAAYSEACAALEEISRPTELLKSIALFILERRA